MISSSSVHASNLHATCFTCSDFSFVVNQSSRLMSGARRRRGFSSALPRATWSRSNQGEFSIFEFFSTCGSCMSTISPPATEEVRSWSCRRLGKKSTCGCRRSKKLKKWYFSLVWSWPCGARQLGAIAPSLLHAPRSTHFAPAKRILHYVAGTRFLGILYRRGAVDPSLLSLEVKTEHNQVSASVDADHAGAHHRRSVSSLAVLLNGVMVTWLFHPVTAISNTENEFYCSCLCVCVCVCVCAFVSSSLKSHFFSLSFYFIYIVQVFVAIPCGFLLQHFVFTWSAQTERERVCTIEREGGRDTEKKRDTARQTWERIRKRDSRCVRVCAHTRKQNVTTIKVSLFLFRIKGPRQCLPYSSIPTVSNVGRKRVTGSLHCKVSFENPFVSGMFNQRNLNFGTYSSLPFSCHLLRGITHTLYSWAPAKFWGMLSSFVWRAQSPDRFPILQFSLPMTLWHFISETQGMKILIRSCPTWSTSIFPRAFHILVHTERLRVFNFHRTGLLMEHVVSKQIDTPSTFHCV